MHFLLLILILSISPNVFSNFKRDLLRIFCVCDACAVSKNAKCSEQFWLLAPLAKTFLQYKGTLLIAHYWLLGEEQSAQGTGCWLRHTMCAVVHPFKRRQIRLSPIGSLAFGWWQALATLWLMVAFFAPRNTTLVDQLWRMKDVAVQQPAASAWQWLAKKATAQNQQDENLEVGIVAWNVRSSSPMHIFLLFWLQLLRMSLLKAVVVWLAVWVALE